MAGISKEIVSRGVVIETAALKLFVRHGFEKVRMGEIADACDISRPTLYAVFANKEAILSSIIRRHISEKLAMITRTLAAQPDLRTKLIYIFDVWIIEPYATVIDAPNAADLSTSAPTFAPQATQEFWTCIEGQVADAMRVASKKRRVALVDELAHVLVTAVKGTKAVTVGLAELRLVVHGLVDMAIARQEALNT